MKYYQTPDYIRIKKMLRFINKNSEGKLLELGLTKGSVADTLSKEGTNLNLYGIDIYDRAIPEVNFIKHDLNEGIPFGDNNFDYVVAGELLEHVFDDEMLLNEIRRVLKKSGKLVLSVPNVHFLYDRVMGLLGKMPVFAYRSYHYHFYNKETITWLIWKSGFKIDSVVSSHILFSSRRHSLGKIFELLGDYFPGLGGHIIISCKPEEAKN